MPRRAALVCSFFICGLAACRTSPSGPGQYPAHWWTPVAEVDAPGWEILPQAAGPGEVIVSKRNELGLLSNFAATPFDLDGRRYASVEGLWQAMKYPENSRVWPADPRHGFPDLDWDFTRDEVESMTAFEAKEAGDMGSTNMHMMGIDWVTHRGRKMDYHTPEKGDHYDVIVRAMRAKLQANPEVRRVLLATGDLTLRPDHKQGENPPPAWRYCDIWMEIREELQGGN